MIPVLAASPGAGASVVAAALADALAVGARSGLLVDTADRSRSGLNRATRDDGPLVAGPHPTVAIRFSARRGSVVSRVESSSPVLVPGMVPPPEFWRPANWRVDATVVDIGHDVWRVAAHPLIGAGAWLRTGSPSPRPVLVVRPTFPGVVHGEQVLARLEPWVRSGLVTPPTQLVVTGARRWPSAVAAQAGRRMSVLLPGSVFLPRHRQLARTGVTAAVTPAPVRAPLATMLRRWGIPVDRRRSASTRSG
ncbi:hypothetical protein FPZ12_008015 [Amycolatopsis acidicola]|uniref:CpsD/CapB family tyrosine-protein kinase n=1 Tax=Amycolatopsis acidicola TaxID=2596893 RepID=A0A5N0VCF7_9PSEU|nr:hypothetical protein FPZ12_008015 [Amycolatopsis acidicola]